MREVEAFIRDARADQRIVLFFAGHGSQQPDQSPADPKDPEPDGLDEVFLPCDAGLWNRKSKCIENAIVDDEIHSWMQQLLAKKVELVLIFDSCHSGSAARGLNERATRRVDPTELIPADILSAVQPAPNQIRGGRESATESNFDGLSEGAGPPYMPHCPTK